MGIDDVFAVIAEGTRRQILENLRDGDKAVGELVIELQVSQPTVSKHLKVLREAGLVSMRAQGQKRYYSLDAAPLGLVREWLAEFDPRDVPSEQPSTGSGSADAVTATGTADRAAAGTGADPTGGGTGATAGTPAGELASSGVDGAPTTATETELAEAGVLAAAVLAGPDSPIGAEASRPPIGRTMGRAAERAADLLSQLRRRRDSSS